MSRRDATQKSTQTIDEIPVPAGLPGREREVTVCFVDLRNYTRHTEENTPADVYRFLSEYFQVVGEVVGRHGGTIVEFQGDGVVVAFGALDDLADKEATALRATREIRRVTRALGIPIRIGVATGTAFVGQMSALDRRAFCVIGHPTVMAASLQGLADELGCGIVADEQTVRAAGREAGLRRHRRHAIEGSSQRHDVFAVHEEGDASAATLPGVRLPVNGWSAALPCPLALELGRAAV